MQRGRYGRYICATFLLKAMLIFWALPIKNRSLEHWAVRNALQQCAIRTVVIAPC